MNTKALLEERRQKDVFFKSHPQSPLTHEQKHNFNGLSYFDPNADLELTVDVEEFEDKVQITMQTTTGDFQNYLKWGKFSFEVGSETVELTLFYSPNSGHFFLPFMDATNQNESYSGGRYLDPERIGETQFHINLNRAYSPYCAYNTQWSCPIPPQDNRLSARIEAGEKRPSDTWAESY